MANGVMDRVGVCSWSLEPVGPDDLKVKLDAVGLQKVQLDLMPLLDEGGAWADAGKRLGDLGVEVVGGMMRAVGEDYSTPARIRETGGVVPDGTWPDTWANVKRMSEVVKEMGMGYVTFHAGFVPHDEGDPVFKKVVDRLRDVADLLGDCGAVVGLETGQETGETLAAFLGVLGRENVKVNFDPANMILYDMGEPNEALRLLVGKVDQLHLKDARKTEVAGEWGKELAVGDGEVDWGVFFRVLEEAGFAGEMLIEREAGEDRVGDIRRGKEFVAGLVG